MLKQTWNIWGVSVLFDFNCDNEVQLKQYAKKLREEVACILSLDDVSYEAKISVLDIQRPKETDHPVVKVYYAKYFIIITSVILYKCLKRITIIFRSKYTQD